MRKTTLLNIDFSKKSARLVVFSSFVLAFFALPFSARAQCLGPNAAEIPNNGFDEDCDGLDDLFLKLPPFVYAVVGQDLEIYFANLILSRHPHDYVFSVQTALNGQNLGKKWRFLPSSNDLGESSVTIEVRSNSGQFLASASTTLRVSPAGLPADLSPKKLWLFGHSFFDQGYVPKFLRDRLDQPDNPPISMHGKKQAWAPPFPKHEGYGGMMWRWFLRDGASPFRYGNNIDLNQYFNDVCGGGQRPDWMIVHLDINDFCGYSALAGATLTEIDDSIENDWQAHADVLIQKIRQAAPQAKLAICISPPPNARESAFSATYGGNQVLNNRWRWQKIISRLIHKNIARYAGRESEGIFLIPEYLDIDDLDEYNPPDARHPDPFDGLLSTHCGYKEITKTLFAWIKYQEHLGTPPVATDFWRDADGDTFGDISQKIQSAQPVAGYVKNAADCDDSKAFVYPNASENCQNGIDDNCNGQTDEDFLPPSVACKNAVTLFLDHAGNAALDAFQVLENGADACGAVTFSIDKTAFSCDQAGQFLPVVLTAKDASGNSATCQTTVEIMDAESPELTCKTSFEIALDALNQAKIVQSDVVLSASDACGLASFSFSKNDLTCFDVGTFQLFVQAKDPSGNQKTCAVEVTVKDVQPPVALCKTSILGALNAAGNWSISAQQINAGSYDGCGGALILELSKTNFDCSDVGAGQLILTIKDAAGNAATCSTNFDLKDDLPPVLACETAVDLPLDASGNAVLETSKILVSATDNCGLGAVFLSKTSFDCSFLGQNVVELTVFDETGLSTKCAATVDVRDVWAPEINCISSFILEVDSVGEKAIVPQILVSSATDACSSSLVFSLSKMTFSKADIGQQTLVLTASDASQNASTCSVLLSVVPSWDSTVFVVSRFFRDLDGDFFGDQKAAISVVDSVAPMGFAKDSTDCDDSNAAIFPSALEKMNGLDDDCDGQTDEGFSVSRFFRDSDGDFFGDANVAILTVNAPVGFVSDSTDCDDSNAAIFPTSKEIKNGFDDDCDAQIDEDLPPEPSWPVVFPDWRAGFLVGPNPADASIFLKPAQIFDAVRVRVFDVFGRLVFEKKEARLHPDGFEIESKAWPKGTYFLQLQYGSASDLTRKMVVLH